MTPADSIASRIDHTILKPEATSAEVHRVVAEAIERGFASVCIAPVWVARVASMLRGSGSPVRCCTVVSFPHGTAKSTVKAIEATSVLKDGADEIDVVAHLPYLLNADADSARGELIEVVRAARAVRREVVIKVIIESAVLMGDPARAEQRVIAACRAIRESGCDFIKTSTGFHPAGGATLEAVRLIKQHAHDLQIKASGGIKDVQTALAFLNAGADRLGTSSSVAILQEYARMNAGAGPTKQ